MNIQRTLICLATLVMLASAPTAPADVLVYFDPVDSVVELGETVGVDIRADFDDPVVAWGIDLTVDKPEYASWIDTAIDPAWDIPGESLDEDWLVGLSFATGASGDVLLATVTFEGLALGETLLSLSSGPEEDEGFLLEAGSMEENVQFMAGTLTVVPEPSGLALLGLGVLAIRLRR
jgi:hypothetical protein